jgi:hypothetical protein
MTARAALFITALIALVIVFPVRSQPLSPDQILTAVVTETVSTAVPVSLTPTVRTSGGSLAQLARLDDALARFAAAGLELPDLDIEFSSDDDACRGHLGYFQPNTTPWRISICALMDSVFEHELAHAWERAVLTDDLREAFMVARGLEVWSDREAPWNERGIEAVAFVIQQGLSDLPMAPALGDEARSRLATFELLIGRPAPRLVRWMEAHEVPCEDRPTALSRTMPDRAGLTCE